MRGSAASAQAKAATSATPSWKAAAIWSSGDLLEVVVDGCDQVCGVDHAGAMPASIGLGLDLAGELLELDRRLTLVAHRLPQSKQGGDRIEEAAHPGERGAFTLRLWRTWAQRSKRTGASGELQVCGGRPPGLPDRGLAAGERHRRRGARHARIRRGRSAAALHPRDLVPSVP